MDIKKHLPRLGNFSNTVLFFTFCLLRITAQYNLVKSALINPDLQVARTSFGKHYIDFIALLNKYITHI